MAIWRAKCWLGSENGYQDLEVKSNTIHGADHQFRSIYGATQVINIREVRSGGSSSSGSSGSVGLIIAVLAIGGWLMWEAWKIVSSIMIAVWQWFVGALQWVWELFPFISPQLIVGLVFGFFFLVLILGVLDSLDD